MINVRLLHPTTREVIQLVPGMVVHVNTLDGVCHISGQQLPDGQIRILFDGQDDKIMVPVDHSFSPSLNSFLILNLISAFSGLKFRILEKTSPHYFHYEIVEP